MKTIHEIIYQTANELLIHHGNKQNNLLHNLEYVTKLENTKHSWNLGLSTKKFGENVSNHKLKNNDIFEIRELLKTSISQEKIGKMYNISPSIISRIKSKKLWSHI